MRNDRCSSIAITTVALAMVSACSGDAGVTQLPSPTTEQSTKISPAPRSRSTSAAPVASTQNPTRPEVQPAPGESGVSIGTPTDDGSPPPTPVTSSTAFDPGRVTLHRLNRAEYNNTVQDLLFTSNTPADTFPKDDRGNGFDNMADVLSLSPVHLNAYGEAAQDLAAEAVSNPERLNGILSCDLASGGVACARQGLRNLLPRAYRRPVTDQELLRFDGLLDRATTTNEGVELALRALLMSPHFLFRVELDPTPNETRRLNDYELASRLSYFLWSSMPDAELFEKARVGALGDDSTLEAEVRRMLRDPRAQALVDNFAAQWLVTRSVDDIAPDANLFPDFDDELRSAMRQESELLFKDVALGSKPFTTLLTADYSFLTDRLAAHYGLPPPAGDSPTRVELPTGQRRGFLGHAGVLSVTSHPTRTSPVNRGLWVMSELLCQEIPSAPPGVDTEIDESEAALGEQTLREALAVHREDPACAACHRLMDPIGFGLENYDAVGAYREFYGNQPIDASGQLPDGRTFSGADELAQLIADDPAFPLCVTRKLYTYALGRPPETRADHLDGNTIAGLAENFQTNNFSFQQLVVEITLSPTFRNRRGEEPSP